MKEKAAKKNIKQQIKVERFFDEKSDKTLQKIIEDFVKTIVQNEG